jgi:hypothetical protein
VTTTTDVREVNNSTNKQNIMSVYPIEDKVNPTGKDDVETKVVDTDPTKSQTMSAGDCCEDSTLGSLR